MWSYVKSKRTDHLGVAPLKLDGKTFTTPKDKANNYCIHPKTYQLFQL